MSAHPSDRLDAYLDGLMSAEERAAFEREIASDASLRSAVEAQARIDASLRRLFAPPAGVPSLPTAPNAVPDRHRNWLFGRVGAAQVAASIIGLVGLAWVLWMVTAPEDRSPPGYPESMSIAQAYVEEVESGYHESWQCRDTREFVTYVWQSLGSGLAFADLPASIKALGLDGCNCISLNTVYLLTTVDGERVIVFIDRKDAKADLSDISDVGLQAFRRDVGELTLYEVTPLEKPHVLEYFKPFDVPDAWKSSGEPILQ